MTESVHFWKDIMSYLQQRIDEQEMGRYLRPLQAIWEDNTLLLLGPNRFVVDHVRLRYIELIKQAMQHQQGLTEVPIRVAVGSHDVRPEQTQDQDAKSSTTPSSASNSQHGLTPGFVFESFVEGKSNQVAAAAARAVSTQPGTIYNPLCIYGGVGLGKTHLMHGIGHYILEHDQTACVTYRHSEGFVADMVRALRQNRMDEFKATYRQVNALLVDDIQFFAGKERSQEEFFNTFNSLLESGRQLVITCDRYPQEVKGIEERLRSRFGSGLTVAIDPPDFETRAAIVSKKAEAMQVELPDDVIYFIARRIRSNVRELEGAMRRVVATAQFLGHAIDLDFTKATLKDLIASHNRMISIDDIQKIVSEYYKIRIADMLSSSRTRRLSRPRQLAMALTKELTNHSLPDIGRQFGGRDHTTVLHACRTIESLRTEDATVEEDYRLLMRRLRDLN